MGSNQVWRSNIAQKLMEEHNTNDIEQAVARLIDHKLRMFQDGSKLDLPVIASILGIKPEFRYVEMPPSQSARIVQDGNDCFIEINKKHSKTRQRFSIGHEIGHRMLLGYKLTGMKARHNYVKSIEEQEEEKLCDLIAKHLLKLTREYLLPILQSEGLSFETLERIAERFDVSFEAVVRSVMECCEAPAAILYCLPLIPITPQNMLPEFVLNRWHKSVNFPVTPQSSIWLTNSTCLKRATLASGIVKLRETLLLDGINKYRFACEAKSMPIYTSSRSEQGVVVLITQPQLIP